MQQSEINNLISMEKDILAHPSDDLNYLDSIFNSDLFSQTEIENINSALSIILHDEKLSENEKGNLLENSWKINHKFKVPTPEEFLTAKWIGPQAEDTFTHVKKTFCDYFNPQLNKTKLVMYCCTG